MDKFDDMKEKGKDLAGEHGDQVNEAIDRGKDFADEKTGGKYSEQIDQAADKTREGVEDFRQQ